MDFAWGPEQLQFRDAVIEFGRKALQDDLLRRDGAAEFSRTLWTRCGEFGIQGLPIPEALPALLDWTVPRLAERIHELGAKLVWLVLRLPTADDSVQSGIALAERAGFDVIDLSRVFYSGDEAGYVKEEWDNHPNARGHQVLSDNLYRALVDRAGQLALTGGQASESK